MDSGIEPLKLFLYNSLLIQYINLNEANIYKK